MEKYISVVVSMATSVLEVYFITDNQAGTQPSHPVRMQCRNTVYLSDCSVGRPPSHPVSPVQEHSLATLSDCSVQLSCCLSLSCLRIKMFSQTVQAALPLLVFSGVLQCMQISHKQMAVTVCSALFQVQPLEKTTKSYDFHDMKCTKCHSHWSL